MTGDPRLDNPIARLSALCDVAACYNDPMTRGGSNGRASGKPSSREPGRQQCPGTIRAIERELLKAITEIERKINNATPKGAGTSEHGITSMGDIEIPEYESTLEHVSITIPATTGPSVNRRKDGTYTSAPRGPRLPDLSQGH